MKKRISIQSYAKPEPPRSLLSKTDWLDIAIIGELADDRTLSPSIIPLIQKANAIAPKMRIKSALILIGTGLTAGARKFFSTGVERIFVYDHPQFAGKNPALEAIALDHYAEEYKPSVLLFANTSHGRSLAAAAAERLKLAAAPVCPDFQLQSNKDLMLPDTVSAEVNQAVTSRRPQLLILDLGESAGIQLESPGQGELVLCELPDGIQNYPGMI